MKVNDTHVTRAHGKRMCFSKACYQMTVVGYNFVGLYQNKEEWIESLNIRIIFN